MRSIDLSKDLEECHEAPLNIFVLRGVTTVECTADNCGNTVSGRNKAQVASAWAALTQDPAEVEEELEAEESHDQECL